MTESSCWTIHEVELQYSSPLDIQLNVTCSDDSEEVYSDVIDMIETYMERYNPKLNIGEIVERVAELIQRMEKRRGPTNEVVFTDQPDPTEITYQIWVTKCH